MSITPIIETWDGTVIRGWRAWLLLPLVVPYLLVTIPLRILFGLPVRFTNKGKALWSYRWPRA